MAYRCEFRGVEKYEGLQICLYTLPTEHNGLKLGEFIEAVGFSDGLTTAASVDEVDMVDRRYAMGDVLYGTETAGKRICCFVNELRFPSFGDETDVLDGIVADFAALSEAEQAWAWQAFFEGPYPQFYNMADLIANSPVVAAHTGVAARTGDADLLRFPPEKTLGGAMESAWRQVLRRFRLRPGTLIYVGTYAVERAPDSPRVALPLFCLVTHRERSRPEAKKQRSSFIPPSVFAEQLRNAGRTLSVGRGINISCSRLAAQVESDDRLDEFDKAKIWGAAEEGLDKATLAARLEEQGAW